MGSREKPSLVSSNVPSPGTTLVILGTIADTTWRMFLPVLLLLGVGWWLDNTTGRKPLFMLSGVIFGFALAVLLVYLQYKRIKTTESQKIKDNTTS